MPPKDQLGIGDSADRIIKATASIKDKAAVIKRAASIATSIKARQEKNFRSISSIAIINGPTMEGNYLTDREDQMIAERIVEIMQLRIEEAYKEIQLLKDEI